VSQTFKPIFGYLGDDFLLKHRIELSGAPEAWFLMANLQI
jgi:hypothetical protein